MLENINTVKELLDAIDAKHVSLASLCILLYLCLIPLIASLICGDVRFFIGDGAPTQLLSSTFPYCDHW